MNATDVRSEIGARFDNPTVIGGKLLLILRARFAWAHDFVTNPALSAAFETVPGGSFTVNGAPIAQNSALTSAGAELFLNVQSLRCWPNSMASSPTARRLMRVREHCDILGEDSE